MKVGVCMKILFIMAKTKKETGRDLVYCEDGILLEEKYINSYYII
jgi:hypothetical protein